MSNLHHIKNRTKNLPPLRVGIGGPVGSGKTTLLEMLCKSMRSKYDLVAITNDIYTKEDQRILTVSGALEAERIMGVETGGCPHTAIREDASINLEAIDRMLVDFPNADIVFIESGGDNLAATFSPELSDLTQYCSVMVNCKRDADDWDSAGAGPCIEGCSRLAPVWAMSGHDKHRESCAA